MPPASGAAPTHDAHARILTSQADTGSVFVFDSGTEVYNFTVPAVYADDLAEVEIGAKMHGWRFLDTPERVGPDQYVVRVEKLARDRAAND